MDKYAPLIPLCRLYQNESQRTGKRYLAGLLSYTTKLVGFQEETADGQTVWQLYVQERLKSSASQNGEQPVRTVETVRRGRQ